MGHKKNKMLLLILSLSLVVFDPAEAVCKPKNSASKLAPGADDHATYSSSSTSKAAPSPTKGKSPSSTSSPPPKAASPPPKSPPPPTHSPPPPKATPPPPAPVFSPPPPKATTPPDDDDDHDSSSSKAIPLSMQEDASPIAQGLMLPGIASLKLKLLCSQITSYPDLCMATFGSFLNANANLEDRMSLFNSAVQIAIKETDALKELTNSYIAKASSPIMATNLKACLSDFDDALEDIQTAMEAVPSKDYGTLTNFLSTAIEDYASCDDEFKGLNPLKTQTERLRHLVDNSLAFAQAVKWT